MRRKLFKVSIYAAAALLLLALLAYLARDPLRDALVKVINSQLSASFAGSLQIGKLRGTLLTSLVLQDIVLRDRQEVVAQVASVRLSYSLFAMLKRQVTVFRADIVRPRLTLTQAADGRWNIARLFPPAAPPPEAPEASPGRQGFPFAVRLVDLQIRDGEVKLHTPSLPGVQQIEAINVQLTGQLDRDGMRVTLRRLAARALPAKVEIQTQGTLRGWPGNLQVDDLRVQTAQTLITLDGVLPGGSRAASLALQLQPLDVTEIGRLLQQDDVQGQLQMTLNATGPAEALAVAAQLHAAEGRIDLRSQLDLSALPLRYRATLDIAHLDLAALVRRADLQSDINLRLHLDGAGVNPREMQGQAQFELLPSHLGRIVMKASEIDLEARPQQFQVRRFHLDTSVARMRMSGAINLAGESDLRYQVTADLSDLQPLLGIDPLGGEVLLHGGVSGALQAINADGVLEVKQLRYQAHRLKDLRLTYDGAQLGTTPRARVELLAHQARIGELPVEQIALQATYQGSSRQVHFSAEVRQAPGYGGKTAGRLTLGDQSQEVVLEELLIHLAKRTWQAVVPLRVALAPQRVHIKQFHLAHGDETLQLSGALQAQHLQDLRLTASRIDLAALRRLVPLPEGLAGRANLQVQMSGTLNEPLLQAEVDIQSATAKDLPFERLHTTVAYAGKQLHSELRIRQAQREVVRAKLQLPVDMALSDLPLTTRLQDAPLTIELLIDRPQLAALHRWQPALPDLSGTLAGSLTLQGAYHRLDLDADMRLHRLGLPGVLEQVNAALHLTAQMAMAPSIQALGEALNQGRFAPLVRQLELRLPSLHAQLPRPDAPPQSIQLQRLLLQAEGAWRPQGVDATLHTLRVQVNAFDLPTANLLLKARMTPEVVELQQMQLRLPQSELRGRGQLALDTQQLRLRVALPRLRLDELVRHLPSTLPSEVRGEIDVQGRLQAPKVTARLQYAGARIRSDIEAQLEGALPRYAVSLRIQDLDTGRLLPGTEGAVQATLRLQGRGLSGDQRQASLDVRVDADRFSLLPGLSSRLRARVDGEAVQLKQWRVQSVPVTLDVNGALSAARQLDLSYRLQLGDLKPLQALLGMSPLQAKGTLAGNFKGPLDALQAHSDLRIDDWRVANWRGKALRAEVAATALPAAPQATLDVHVDEVQGPALPSSSIRVAGSYRAPRGTFTVDVTQGPYQQTQLAGEVVYQQELRLVLDRLRLRGHGLAWENNGAIKLVRDAQGGLRLQSLQLRSGEQVIMVQGTLSREGAVAADLRLRQLQIQPLLHAVAPAISQPDGQLTLDLKLGGSIKQPQLTGQLGLTALQWQQHSLGEIGGRIGLTGETLQTDLRWRDAQVELLHLHGTLGMGATGRLAMQVQSSDFDMHRLEPFSPMIIESAGRLILDLQVAGTLLQPQLNGRLEWRDGALQLLPTGERYRDIQVHLRFAGERVDIARMQVGSRSGDLQLTGHIEHAGRQLRQIDISVQGETFTALHTPDIEAVVSTNVTVSGSLHDLFVSGTITVPRARYRLSGKLGGGPAAVEPWELTVKGVYGSDADASAATNGSTTANHARPPLPFLRTDLSLDIPRNVWVQRAGTAIEIQGKLKVTKALQAPFIISGTVQTVRGFATFYGKKFVLQKGQVTFPGSEEINPFLDVTTTYKASDYLVTIQVDGKAKQPKLTLSSDPDLEQADIISLLVFGKTTDRLTSSEQSALSSQTQAVAGGVAAGMLEQTIGKTLGLDTIEVESGEALGSGRIGVGRYVTQDIFVTYERQFGKSGESGNTVGVEYNIKGNLKVKGSSSDLGESAIDLLWSMDY